MAKATVTTEPIKKELVVNEDVYRLELTRDEAIAIFSLVGKVGIGTENPELDRASWRVFDALQKTGVLRYSDSLKLTIERSISPRDTSLTFTKESSRLYNQYYAPGQIQNPMPAPKGSPC